MGPKSRLWNFDLNLFKRFFLNCTSIHTLKLGKSEGLEYLRI